MICEYKLTDDKTGREFHYKDEFRSEFQRQTFINIMKIRGWTVVFVEAVEAVEARVPSNKVDPKGKVGYYP